MTQFHPQPGGYELTMSHDEIVGSRRAIDYLRMMADEHLEPERLVDLAQSIVNIDLALQLGLISPELHEDLSKAADTIYNLPKT